MKNLIIYISPRKDFDDECKKLVKIQIDNSFKFWKKEDILLVTNFEYEYNEIKAIVISDKFYCKVHDKASKINAIIYLLKEKKIDEITWFHDFDAFQLEKITEKEVNLKRDIGFTDYGWSKKWNTGSIFFKPNSLDIFRLLNKSIYELKTDEERALVYLTKNNINNIRSRIERLNIRYNFGMRRIEYNLGIAIKPLKVVHFHPARRDIVRKFKPIVNEGLYKQFEKYGFA